MCIRDSITSPFQRCRLRSAYRRLITKVPFSISNRPKNQKWVGCPLQRRLQLQNNCEANGTQPTDQRDNQPASDPAASVTFVVEVEVYGTGDIGPATGRRSKHLLLPLFLVNPRSRACLVSEVASREHSSTRPGMISNH